MLAFELDGLLGDLQIALTDWANLPLLLYLLSCQSLEILLGQSLRDFTDLVSKFK
jgi:hypothetical protein